MGDWLDEGEMDATVGGWVLLLLRSLELVGKREREESEEG